MNTVKNIVGVKFKKEGKVYSFDAGDLQLKKKEDVIVDTDSGLAIGTVETNVTPALLCNLPDNLRNVVRKATEKDIKRKEENQNLEKEAFTFCLASIRKMNLPMKLVGVEYSFDRSKVTFCFTADRRVDFRELVKDLVQKFRTRIELRQIGRRNEAAMLGGIGVCGREICCSRFLPNLDRVSLKMAKEQNVSLNPEKISGICGRLMCCLAFEYDNYIDLEEDMQKCGSNINTVGKNGKDPRQNILQGKDSGKLKGGKEINSNQL